MKGSETGEKANHSLDNHLSASKIPHPGLHRNSSVASHPMEAMEQGLYEPQSQRNLHCSMLKQNA